MNQSDQPRPTEHAEQHVHRPMMAVLTCDCGERAVLTDDGRLESADFNWMALDRYFEKVAPHA